MTRFQVFRAQYGQQNFTPAGSAVPTCTYFTAEQFLNASTKATVPTVLLNDYLHMGLVADALWKGTVGGSSGSMSTVASDDPEILGTTTSITSRFQVKSHVLYTLRCASNEAVEVVMYICKARGNVVEKLNPNIYETLARGFAINGLDPTHATAVNNAYMTDPNFNPYNSELFTSQFKILRRKSLTIRGGRTKKVRVKSRPFYFKPANFYDIFGTGSSTSWSGAGQLYSHPKYTKFALFQLKTKPIGTGVSLISGNSQTVSTSSDVIEMVSLFTYKARIMRSMKTPSAYIDGPWGFTVTANANNIMNQETLAPAIQGNVF